MNNYYTPFTTSYQPNNNINQGYYQPNQFTPTTNTQNQNYIIKTVSSFEEAKNTSADIFNTFVFLDTQNNYIYLKSLNNNGLEEFATYKRTENPKDKINILEEKINNIENLLLSLGGKQNASNVNADDDTTTATKPATVPKRATNVVRQDARPN